MKPVKICFFILFILFSNLKIEAQRDCINGRMNSKDVKDKKICFTRETFPYVKSYYTKYLIEVDMEEVYEIGFHVYKDADSILVQQFDKLRSTSKSVLMTFRDNDCFNVIKDYQVNEKDIDDNASVSILFNIPNAEERYVNLNSFKDMTDETYYFLQKIQPEVLDPHIQCVEDHNKSCDFLQAEFTKNENSIKALKAKMLAAKDREVKKMKDDIEAIRTGNATEDAPEELQEEFNKKIDRIFRNQFGNYYSFENNDIDAEFKFKFDGSGKLQTNIGRSFKNGSQNWFNDMFTQKIKPAIEQETPPVFLRNYNYNPDVLSDLLNSFKDSISYYDTIRQRRIYEIQEQTKCDTLFMLSDKNKSAFTETKKEVSDAFEPFGNMRIGKPAVYPYKYRYTTTVSEVTGKWKNGNNEFDVKSGSLSQVLLYNKAVINKAFNEKFAPDNTQKYHIRICSLSINGVLIGVDIQMLE
jgi:hypothetical protein